MKRGEIWTMAGGPDYAGKPRPAVIIQSDKFDSTQSVTICPFTGTAVDAAYARFAIAPSANNGLRLPSSIMVDKIVTVPRSKLGDYVGQLDGRDATLLNQRIAVFLGLAD